MNHSVGYLQFLVLLPENETAVIGAALRQLALQTDLHPLILLQSHKNGAECVIRIFNEHIDTAFIRFAIAFYCSFLIVFEKKSQ